MIGNIAGKLKREFGTLSAYMARQYFADVVAAVEDAKHCRVHLRPIGDPAFKGQAQTWSRVLEVKGSWPEETEFRMPDHWIIFDRKLPAAAAARCIAHELHHIAAHDPTSSKRQTDENYGVLYTREEEMEADWFSLLLLSTRQFAAGRRVPETSEELMGLLRTEAGKPAHLTWEEIEEGIRYLRPTNEEGTPDTASLG